MDKRGIAALAAQGRGEDSLLVHMAPNELQALQAIAKQKGLSLTTNPKTGLPEVGILSSILPAVAGAAGMYFGGPLGAAAAGAATGYLTGNHDLSSAVTGGLAGYGGGSLASGLMAPGMMEATMAGGPAGVESAGLQAAAAQAPEGDVMAAENAALQQQAMNGTSNMGLSGLESAQADPMGFAKNNWKSMAMAASPLLLNAMQPSTMPGQGPGGNANYIRPAAYHQARNPNWGKPGEPYFDQSFSYGTPYRAAQGGAVPGSNGIADVGYAAGGKLLRGPGDGVSDSIPASINGTHPARLADGEFVVPARIVSELGNGSSEAGARALYKMMDRVQKLRQKTKDVAADTRATKHLPV